jgi:hypothetical protein
VLLVGRVQEAGAQASPWLARDHWSRAAAVRLHALNATPGGFDPAARVHTVKAMGAALAGCADDIADASLPGGCVAAFAAERGGLARAWVEAAAGYALREGALLGGGFTPEREWTGPRRLADRRLAVARVRIDGVPVPRVAISAGVEADADGVRIEQANAELRLGRFGVWAGRRVLGYAPGAGGGLVLNGAVPVDGGGVRIADAVRLAWLGEVTAELFAGQADSSGFVARPWLLGLRLHARPHVRFDLGATRAAVFGGMAGARVGVQEIAEVLVGANPGGRYADDQVASLDARWRPPVPRIPLELFGEWALHDVDLEVLLDMPAITLGVRMPVIPGAAALGMTLEHTRIAGSCCGNPPWYHHFELAGGWTDTGVLRGHPLGGQGREWRVSLDAALLDWRVRVRADALMRTRLGENLFAPDRAGSAHGGALTVTGALSQHSGVELQLAHEAGRGWGETHAFLALSWHR